MQNPEVLNRESMNQDFDKNCDDVPFECPQGVDPEERKVLLQRIIDGQATESEAKYFYKTLENCENCQCRHQCDQHLEIKNLLKEKIINKPLPEGLIEDIKNRILKS